VGVGSTGAATAEEVAAPAFPLSPPPTTTVGRLKSVVDVQKEPMLSVEVEVEVNVESEEVEVRVRFEKSPAVWFPKSDDMVASPTVSEQTLDINVGIHT
jgi:hypothetical protein